MSGTVLGSLHTVCLSLSTLLQVGCVFTLTDKEMDAQRSYVTCPRSKRVGFELKSV